MCWRSFAQAGVRVPLAVSSMLLNQHYILNKASFIRNTHNIRFYIYQWTKVCDRVCRVRTLHFPEERWPSVHRFGVCGDYGTELPRPGRTRYTHRVYILCLYTHTYTHMCSECTHARMCERVARVGGLGTWLRSRFREGTWRVSMAYSANPAILRGCFGNIKSLCIKWPKPRRLA